MATRRMQVQLRLSSKSFRAKSEPIEVQTDNGAIVDERDKRPRFLSLRRARARAREVALRFEKRDIISCDNESQVARYRAVAPH